MSDRYEFDDTHESDLRLLRTNYKILQDDYRGLRDKPVGLEPPRPRSWKTSFHQLDPQSGPSCALWLHVIAVSDLGCICIGEIFHDFPHFAGTAECHRVFAVKLGIVPVHLGETQHLRRNEIR